MKQSELIRELSLWDKKGRHVFTTSDLFKITGSSSNEVLRTFLSREQQRDVPLLRRVARGVYIFAHSQLPKTHMPEHIARALRRGSHSYVSLESALSEHGRISQIPVGTLTIMTTGRSGRFLTEGFGTIEFTHTKRHVLDILRTSHEIGRPLRLASSDQALEDLRNVGRNLHLVMADEEPDVEELNYGT